eukprot:gene31012-37479_t
MARFASSFNLGDIVKSRGVNGVRLQVTAEPGTPNDFGVFDKNMLNPTAAYIDQGRDGYMGWKGQWFATAVWDRDTVAYPPAVLDCVHVTEIPRGASTAIARHGWIFVDELEKIDVSTLRPETAPSAEDERIKSEVKAWQKRNQDQRALIQHNKQLKEAEIDRIQLQINVLKVQRPPPAEQIHALERQRDELEQEMWSECGKSFAALQKEERACNEIIFKHDHIDFS